MTRIKILRNKLTACVIYMLNNDVHFANAKRTLYNCLYFQKLTYYFFDEIKLLRF